MNDDNNEIQKAIQYLKDMSWKIGSTAVEYLSENDGKKMRECIDLIERKISDSQY